MARTTRSSRRFRRAKRELIWATVLMDNVAANVAGAGSSTALVLPVDWQRSANFEKGAVLLGIRGWYSFTYGNTSTVQLPTVFFSIAKMAVDEVNQDWTVSTPYNGEDVLYTDGVSLGGPAVLSFAGMPPSINLARQLEVKAKRKLDTDAAIVLNFQSPTAAEDWFITGVFRSLIQLP